LKFFTTFRRVYQDKAETAPLFPASTSMSPSGPLNTSGSATINRTLLHSQQFAAHNSQIRNGTTRGLANHSLLNGDSPPPTYDVVVHDISLQRHGFILLLYYFLLNIFTPQNEYNFLTHLNKYQSLLTSYCSEKQSFAALLLK
jgi:hypothetical protein